MHNDSTSHLLVYIISLLDLFIIVVITMTMPNYNICAGDSASDHNNVKYDVRVPIFCNLRGDSSVIFPGNSK